LTKLWKLNLARTKVSAAGLKDLETLTNLTQLYLNSTKVTAAGVEALRKALPMCQIQSDFPAK